TEVNKLESLITEKNKEISRIEGKELDKSEYQEKLKKLEHVNQSLKDNVEDIENAHSKIKQNNNNKDNALNEIKGFEKNLKGLKASIKEKNTEVQRIEKKECEIKKLEDELNKFDHHNLQLKTLIDNISNTLSELTHLNREIDRINREKSEIGHLKDEKELKTHYDAYEEISSLEEKTNRIVDSVKSLDNDISLKKEQLGNLKDEKGDLGDIEKKYESGKSKATLFIVSGIFISLLGAALGFLINLFLITLMFIGIIPLYKGYKDRNFFKTKLDDIKEKREFFGQLKQLEIQKKEKEDEHNSYLKKLDNYKKLDRKTLEKDHKTYKNLENQIKTLKNLDNNKIDVEKRIKDFKEDLSNFYEKLPDHYKQDVPITDLEIDKKLTTIYQDEDKQKNSLKTSINELYKEIPRKSEIIEGKDKLEIKKQEIETQINKKEGNINEILKSEKKLGLKLKNLFERLPTHYKEEASIDDENMDKIISKIYQEEDREKNKYLTAIEGLDEEISRKDEVIKDKVGLESQKTKVENQIKDKNQRLTKELEGYYNNLPTHYKEEASIDDENMDKIISKIYQKEDREKNKYLTAIEGLDEEISRKDEVIKDKVGLESQKTKVEN
ncbi:ATP-binding protein, partial [Methanobacterium sp. MZD130B]|uniref:ATP-binding protein n=1 Tax=Methanobacterium sp. MZD130B TaxID=3394378 RepID=UPI0039FBF76C